MSNTPSLFESNLPANNALLDKLRGINDNLAGNPSGSGLRRISIKGGRFRKMVSGEQVAVSKDSSMHVIIVNAAAIARTYYAGQYNPENPSAPACWSHDTKKPAPEVPIESRQAAVCRDCPQDVKGSGMGNSRACRFSQRLAVCIEGDLNTVYQLQVPATSIFGEAENGNMPLGAYARLLKEHDDTPASAVVTEMYFDENSETPKLFFKPLRPLEESELEKVIAMSDSPEVIRCIELTVSQADGVQKLEAPKAKVAADPKPAEEVVEEVVEAPKKVAKRSEPAIDEESEDLSAIIDGWDD